MEAGKLYICEEYFLLLYPDPETALAADYAHAGAAAATNAASYADYWTNRLGKPVYYTEKKVPLLSLNNKEQYVEVLAGDRKGWIIFDAELGIKEIQ